MGWILSVCRQEAVGGLHDAVRAWTRGTGPEAGQTKCPDHRSLSYIAGGLVPLAPYFFFPSVHSALIGSVVVTLLALLVFGYVKGRFDDGQVPFRPVRGKRWSSADWRRRRRSRHCQSNWVDDCATAHPFVFIRNPKIQNRPGSDRKSSLKTNAMIGTIEDCSQSFAP